MAKELTTLPTVEIKGVNWALNQATTLEFDETCLVENRLLHNGDELTVTDADMGEIFRGWVNAEKGKKAQGDEGGNGNAADLGRCLSKQRAYLLCPDACPPMGAPGTSKFRIRAGTTIRAAIEIATKYATVGADRLGVLTLLNITTALGNQVLHTDIDKGGMSMADWINAILEQTQGGCWRTKGSALYVYDFYLQTECVLDEADFIKPMPDPRTKSVIESYEVGESTDNKYRRVVVEGSGIFTRRILQNFSGPSCAPRAGELVYWMTENGLNRGHEYASDNWLFKWRWYLPENVCCDNYFDANGLPANGCFLSYKLTYNSGASIGIVHEEKDKNVSLIQDTDPYAFDVGPGGAGTDKGNWSYALTYAVNDIVKYFGAWYKCIVGNISNPPTNVTYWEPFAGFNSRAGRFYVEDFIQFGEDHLPDPPVFDNGVGFKVRYTSYDGPFVVSKTNPNPKLIREGDFPVQREDLCKYTQPETRSPFTTILPGHEGDIEPPPRPTYFPIVEAALTFDPTAEMQEICNVLYPSKCGTHYTGSIPVHMSPKLKDVVLGQYIGKFGTDCRIRSIKFDHTQRRANLEVSGQSLRDVNVALTLLAQQKAEGRGNWGKRAIKACLKNKVAGVLPSIVLKDNCQPLSEGTVDVTKTGCTTFIGS